MAKKCIGGTMPVFRHLHMFVTLSVMFIPLHHFGNKLFKTREQKQSYKAFVAIKRSVMGQFILSDVWEKTQTIQLEINLSHNINRLFQFINLSKLSTTTTTILGWFSSLSLSFRLSLRGSKHDWASLLLNWWCGRGDKKIFRSSVWARIDSFWLFSLA